MDAAKLWMIEHQLGQRNLNNEHRSYWIGKHCEREKRAHGGDRKSSGQNGHSKTRDEIAKQHKVGSRTVERDSQFARAVDTIAANTGDEARTEILDGDLKLTRQEVQQLAEIAKAQPLALIASVNLMRRNLTKGQQAMAILSLLRHTRMISHFLWRAYGVQLLAPSCRV